MGTLTRLDGRETQRAFQARETTVASLDPSTEGASRARIARRDALLGELAPALDWPAERIAAERERRLRLLLALAVQHSPWHRERLSGVDPVRFREADLASLPVMTKADMLASFDWVLTTRDLTLDAVNAWIESLPETPLAGRYWAVASGGSSGLRGVYVYDLEGAATFSAMVGRRMVRTGMPPAPAPDEGPMVTCWAGRGAHVSWLFLQLFPSLARPLSLPATTPLAELVARLGAWRPSRLGSYASVLSLLVAEQHAGRLDIAPRWVLNCGEPLLDETRRAVEATWPARVIDYWGMSEGVYAIPCAHDAGMHLPDDIAIVEPVDEDGRPVPPGVESAKILVTNLYNTVQPLIRYEVTDRVVLLDEPCRCGSAHRRLASVRGRTDDVFTYPGGVRVHPLAIRAPLGRHRAVAEYQVHQTPDGVRVRVCASGPLDPADLVAPIAAALRAAGVPQPRVDVELVEALPRQDSGKVRRFVPLPAR